MLSTVHRAKINQLFKKRIEGAAGGHNYQPTGEPGTNQTSSGEGKEHGMRGHSREPVLMSSAAEVMTVSLMVQLTCDDVNWAPVGLVFQATGWITARVMCSVCYYFHSFNLFLFAICEAVNELFWHFNALMHLSPTSLASKSHIFFCHQLDRENHLAQQAHSDMTSLDRCKSNCIPSVARPRLTPLHPRRGFLTP